VKSSVNRAVQDAAAYIKAKKDKSPSIGIITGSGLDFAGLIERGDEIPYKEIPGFPCSKVRGHKNRVMIGKCGGENVIILQGRVHYYEGYSMEDITFPVKVLSEIGVKNIILTNAAGSMKTFLKPGDFMVINDHINLTGINPLRGLPDHKDRSRFVDMSQAHDRDLINKTLELGFGMGIMLHCGVLAAVSGPSYETPAEIQMIRTLGADAVCMSTIPEVIMSRYLGMKVLGLSVITNYAAGLGTSSLRHEEVVKVARSRSKDAVRLLSAIIKYMPV